MQGSEGRLWQTGESGTDNETETKSLSRDELFHVLRNQRRRLVIHCLKRDSQPVTINALSTQVAAWENEIPVEEVTSKQRRRVYNAFHQTHFPTLEDAGIIRVDGDDVKLTAYSKQLDIYLELVPKNDIPWAEYYTILAGIQILGVTAVWFNIWPLSIFPPEGVATVFAIALLISSLVYYYEQRRARLGGQETPPEIQIK